MPHPPIHMRDLPQRRKMYILAGVRLSSVSSAM